MCTGWGAANRPQSCWTSGVGFVRACKGPHKTPHTSTVNNDTRGPIMDAVVIGSILAVGITIAIVIFLAIRIVYLINHTHSQD